MNKKQMPIVALRELTILPNMITHFDVNRKKSITALEKAMTGGQEIFLISQVEADTEHPGLSDLQMVGTIASVKQLIKMPNHMIRVLVEGLCRGEVETITDDKECLIGEIYQYADEEYEIDEIEKEALVRMAKDLLERYAMDNTRLTKEIMKTMVQIQDPGLLADQIAANLQFNADVKQSVLNEIQPIERLHLIIDILNKELSITKIKKEIQVKVKAKIDKNQRDYILREQLKVIREELGDTTEDEVVRLKERVKKLKASKDVKEKILTEVEKIKKNSASSSEMSVIHGHIEMLLDMPWDKSSKESKDMIKAEKILNADHYGLEKVKERILEYLAVRTLCSKGDAPILCLVGPPGTGKTSIARSIAKSLGRKYVRLSLGGVRDEAEIRGHRKTYVGAMPGRIASSLRQAGVKNPLMVFDEIDKLGNDYKGDPSSALLEVLDSEQNNKFRDHYLEIPIDLSEVLFIATANGMQGIPKPLHDRMEMIHVSGYTENEKVHIANRHLIGKQLSKNGLTRRQFSLTNEALELMISGYTKEAGVRELERKISRLCRKAVKEILTTKSKSVKVTKGNLHEYLGKVKYEYDPANERDEVGIVRGLAWTNFGGDTLQIEVNVMQGSGKLSLTGKLGDVMKESAQIALSYIRSISQAYDIDKKFFYKHDIHIHIPDGAVPKDGPSAGITMATAVLSAITNIPVKASVAMTGEINLRGKVLPIGGLKEKLLAAKRAGIQEVLVPSKNEKDLEEIEDEVKGTMNIILTDTMDAVLEQVLVRK